MPYGLSLEHRENSEMGSTRRLGSQRLHSTTPRGDGDETKILNFDPARRPKHHQNLPRPKRPPRPVPPSFSFSSAIWNVIAFLFGTSRRRNRRRGTEPSGKRRA